MRFSGGSAASRRTPTVLTSFLVLVGVVYVRNACTCSAGRGGALSGIHSPPGKLHWFHLMHGLLLLTGEGRVGVAMWQKEVCVSTSAWNCHRGAQAAAVTQLLAAALHVSSAALLQDS